MNMRRDWSDVFAQSPLRDATTGHDLVSQHLQSNTTLPSVLATLILVYLALAQFGFIPLSLPQNLWRIFVYLTPSRIVVALDSKTSNLDSTDKELLSMSSQAKSEAMQRILGVDGTSPLSFFSRSTTLSGFGTALLGGKDNVPPGLGNWDNSCYQNSIIQGLASLKSLSAYLERNIDVMGDGGLFSTHEALKGIIDRLNSATSYGQRLWTPPSLKSMSSWQQQDAQEYFAKVVDQIDREIQSTSRRQTTNMGLKIAGPEEHVVRATPALDGTDERPIESTETTSFRNPLEGLLAQRVGCMQCGWTEGLSLIPFNCLTVPLGSKMEYDLQDCLDEYMNLEPIEGVECAKCTLLHAQKQLQSLLDQLKEAKDGSSSPESPESPNPLKISAQERLQAVEDALAEDDFAEKTLSTKCHIPSKHRVTTTKSRQAVIARSPQCLAIHVNRSLFDEYTFMLRKNYASVHFPKNLDLNEWCLGTSSAGKADKAAEKWDTDPKESMLPEPGKMVDVHGRHYELRAVVTHYGRHENGHYICYRKYPSDLFPANVPDTVVEADGEKEKTERWFRLSDDDVQMVSESSVMSQGGAFMLFYEAIEPSSSKPTDMEDPAPVETERAESTSSSEATDASNASPATSVSGPEKAEPSREDKPADDSQHNAIHEHELTTT